MNDAALRSAEEIRDFALGDILSVTTGILVSRDNMVGVHGLLHYMSGDVLHGLSMVAAAPPCERSLLEQHPQLRQVEARGVVNSGNHREWLAEQERAFGERLPVRPLPDRAGHN